MHNYIIGDLISRINVAGRSHLRSVLVLNTRFSLMLVDVLYKNGLIQSFKILTIGKILIFLKFYQNQHILSLKLISRPGRKVFWSLGQLSLHYNSNTFGGFYIISTSFGLVTSNDCLLGKRICGEVLLKVSI